MAHPKRRQSTTRRDKRRTHYKAETPQLGKCSSTGQLHLYHRAHWHEGKLYYRGKVVLEKEAEEVSED
ncbi:MAG: 50S ribosomal protein L32 [Flavobacteriales bacterium]|nr:50S ribosomal protein L32 [Flavobacteriales bacterium]